MNESFDPYYNWLAIPREQQPPHAYLLLGVPLFEANSEVIANAADARMAYVRSFQTGPMATHSQRLLNELSAARMTLLDPTKRAAYDQTIREAREGAAAARTKDAIVVTPSLRDGKAASGRRGAGIMLPIGIVAIGLTAVVIGAVVWQGGKQGGNSILNGEGLATPSPEPRAVASFGSAPPSTAGADPTWVGAVDASAGFTTLPSFSPMSAPPAAPPAVGAVVAAPATPRKNPASGGAATGAPPPPPFLPPNIPGDARPRIATPFPAHWTNTPRAWLYERDGLKLAFFPTHAGWREVSSEGLLPCSGHVVHGTYVEMQRENPPLRIRLYDDRCDVSVRGGDFFTVHRGRWATEPYPFARALRFTGQGSVKFPEIRHLFRKGSPFLIELWWRPIADQPIGTATLLSCGRTRLNWEVQAGGGHRFVVSTTGRPGFFLTFPSLDADWSILHFGSDGQRLFLADRGFGTAQLLDDYLAEESSDEPLRIGESPEGGNGLWIDVAQCRVSSRCRVTATGDASQKSLSFRPPLELPDQWRPDGDTLALLDASRVSDGRVADRSAKNQPIMIDRIAPVDVIRAIPFFRPVAEGRP